jgi:glucose-1-phosphatase
MVIQAVIWDLGGVLLRTEDGGPREALARRLGRTRAELEKLVFSSESGDRAQLGEIDVAQHWENLRTQLGFTSDELEMFRQQFWQGDVLDRKLVAYIRELRSRYKTGLLSNAFSDLRAVVTDHWKFADAFDVMVISAEVHLVKPDARIYRLALERLGVAPRQAVFIDDFSYNVEGARAQGLHAIHFRSPSQARAELEQLLDGHNP